MGLYRLTLAALVVLFHFGGLSWVVGRIAVFAFYCISGFLIFQVLDRVYLGQPMGVWRFLSNRFVRLYPLYLVYCILTLAMLQWFGPGAMQDPELSSIVRSMDEEDDDELIESATFDPDLSTVESMPVLEFSPALIPQGWSLGVEASLYVIAPLVVLMARRHVWWLAVWIAAGLAAFLWGVDTAGLDPDRFQTVVYKNVFTSAFVFLAGGALYYVRRRVGQPLPIWAVSTLVIAWLATLTIPAWYLGEGPAQSGRVFTEYLWLTLLVAGLVALTSVDRLRAFDGGSGSLCYGVYLNHFLVAGLLLRAGLTHVVGPPGTLAFGFAVLAGSVALAFVTYHLVERPFDRVRSRVRGRDVPQPAVTQTSRRVPVAVIAVAVCLALLANVAGLAVEYVSDSGVVAERVLSPAFNIRWRPGMSDEDRRRAETGLELVEGTLLERDPRRRTWTYRLRGPTASRVRAVLTHPAVEDTAGIDPSRLEILQ